MSLVHHTIHVFPVAGPYCGGFCGHSETGDGWTALPQDITCPLCGRAVAALMVPPGAEEPWPRDGGPGGSETARH